MIEERPELAPLPEDGAFSPFAVGMALGAAVLGVVAWAVILNVAKLEIGWLAWGIGALVGLATVKGGGRGVPMAATAAVLALLSIVGGKFVGTMIFVDRGLEGMISEQELRDGYRETQRDAEAWARLGDAPSDQEVAQFMVDRGFTDASVASAVTEDELAFFQDEVAHGLTVFHQDPPSFEDWSRDMEASFREFVGDEVAIMDLVIQDLGVLDFLFAVLGILSAWGMVMKASATRHTASIRASRARRRR